MSIDRPGAQVMRDTIEQFRGAIRSNGIEPPPEIIADGKLHRFSSNGKHGDDAGWYVLHDDGIPAGEFGDWRSPGSSQKWHADNGHQFTPVELKTIHQRQEAARKARELEEAQSHEEAAQRAVQLWEDDCRPVEAAHPYLKAKGIHPHCARVYRGGYAIAGTPVDGALVISLSPPDGKVSTLQFITPVGRKLLLPGGKKAGSMCFVRNQKGAPVYVAEGFATACTVAEALPDMSVVAAIDAGNLLPVAQAIRTKFPDRQIVIVADDDHRTPGNPGIAKATEAARAVGALLAVPTFKAPRPDGATDFNDLAAAEGLDAARACLNSAASVPSVDAETPSVDDAAVDGWPDPLPLVAGTAPSEYPLQALPAGIRAAVEEVVGFVQCPVALAVCSALSTLSLPVQALVDVRRAEGLTGPVSLYVLALAESGERKTTCDERFAKPIRDFETEQREELCVDAARHAAEQATWEAQRKAIEHEMAQKKVGADLEPLTRKLETLELARPIAPRIPRLVYKDATPEALAFGLAHHWPSAGVLSAEAGTVFGGHAMKPESVMMNLAQLNTLWDGGDLTVDRRAQGGSYVVHGGRLTMGLAVQPAMLRAFIKQTRGLARGSGLIARFLVASPVSTQGTRLFREPPKGWPSLLAFHRRIDALLRHEPNFDERGALTPVVLDLSPEARKLWIQFHDDVESQLGVGGELADSKDVASKAADNAARIAALFHVYENGPSGEIGPEAMRSAATIVAWHLYEARRILGELDLPAHNAAAVDAAAWLVAKAKERGANTFVRREIQQQISPGYLRKPGALEPVLRDLAEAGHVREVTEGRPKLVLLNPKLLGAADGTA